MKTSFTIHTSPNSLDNDYPLLYFKKGYLKTQDHPSLICYESNQFFLPVSLEGDFAISVPRSPFGSFFVKDSFARDEFLFFISEVKNDLRKKGISTLSVMHPSDIYSDFVEKEYIEAAGLSLNFSDINQHIHLQSNWEDGIHDMQKRKLASLRKEGFEFRKMDSEELEKAHQFIKVCRMAQELSINISYDILKQLSDSTGAYDLFGVFRDDKISALCIAARVTEKTAYYFLPATSPMFRSQSPMVLLIAGMVEHYHSHGFEFLDLGVSSIEGKPQETLRIFKERMGAAEQEKTSWTLSI